MKTLVAGIGNPIRTDSGVGPHVIRRLQAAGLPGDVDVIELATAGLDLLDRLEGYDRLIVIDAIVTGATPGTVHELTGDAMKEAVHMGAWHEADFPTTLALGRDFMGRRIPPEIVVLAIEAVDIITFSERLSPGVEAAVPDVVERILAEITGEG